VATGRRDGTVSAMQEALDDIPKHTMTFPQLASLFASKGLGVRDLVWLSGTVRYPLLYMIRSRDGNGDPIPDFPRGIPLLGDGDGKVSFPMGM
jgi:hypothetical protein